MLNGRRLCYLLFAAVVYTLPRISSFAASVNSVHESGVGHLTINRLPNLGGGIGAFISIDGVSVARIGWGESYHGSLAPGDHVISITVQPNFLFRAPAEKRLNVRAGENYIFTLRWKGDRLNLM